ncbi:hybrid sensor histidine kinase/response regulator transcription factor [Niastella yeongjuensis]|uniref:hybrid sensor histidine kinase/response regulator transcription factor n=1 Tax=Niastella yeongjuensis TaxID=354355 RepID=UPI0013FD3F61|nr:hybrid sensor histidine kinase/response regulator transcription factor [Niastella yeongjuensis]
MLLLVVATAVAQPKCKVEYFSTENGLSHQAVTSTIKDREGFMWFGSWDGINRFDGRSFISFKSFPGDSSQLGNDRIDQIVEDQSDHLWIQAYDRHVYRFDKKSEQFLPLYNLVNQHKKQKVTFSRILRAANGWVWLQTDREGLYCVPQKDIKPGSIIAYSFSSNDINFFHEDKDKKIWVGTSGGLNCLLPSPTGEYKNSNINVPHITDADYTVVDEDNDQLYFGTADGQLIIYNKKANNFSSYQLSADHLQGLLRSRLGRVIYASSTTGQVISFNLDDKKITTNTYSPAVPLYSLYEDKQGGIWIEPRTEGIIRFDPVSQAFHHFSRQNTDRLNVINNHVKIWEDNNGLVWCFLKGGGFGYYNAANGKFDYTLSTPDAGITTLPANVYTVYFDKAGVLWLTTNERQLIKIILQSNVFKQQLLTDQVNTKFDNEVRGIFYDSNNRLWVGAKNGKYYVYQNNKRITGLFDNEPAEGLGLVYAIIEDRLGNIWLGTKANGIYKAMPLDKAGTKYHLQHFLPTGKGGGTLPCNDIYSLLEDKQGRIWIGSFDKGVYLVKEEGGNVQFLPAVVLFKNYPKDTDPKIRHMALDANGNIWAGTTNGLLLLQTGDKAGNCSLYQKIPGDKNSLGNNDIQFVFRDSKNRMWLATSGGGFCLAMGNRPFQTLQFRNYTTKDGMPNDYVLSCAEDAQGNLWLATENGLSRFDAEQLIFRNFDSYDGLPRASFSEAAACLRLPGGQLVFGSTKGCIAFDPVRLNNDRMAASIAFTNLQINNEDAGPGRNDSALTLKYNQNIISIEYAMLDQRAGNRHALVYRLLGFDSTWYSDRQQRRTTYTNLPPGKYVFEVKSLSTDLYSNTPYKSVAITILPPPWKTWWAYLIYIICIGSLLVIIRRYALAMIRLRNKVAIEKRLAALKINFFTNISHELRTPLTLIINPIEQLLRKEKLSTEGTAWVEVARKNANRMVRFINQLLDLRKVESNKATLHISRVEVVNFVQKISDHFTGALKSKQLSLEINAEPEEVIAWIDAEKLDIVIFNLLANAVKFTPAGKAISITISQLPVEQSFLIAVSDQGPGVDAGKLKDIFDLFYEADHPATTQKGSGIGLALSKELVHLHGGDIWAVNNERGGLTVSVKIKLGARPDKQEELLIEQMDPEMTAYPEQEQVEQLPIQQSPADPQAPLVLLVEDNDELRSFLSSQLSEFYRVEVATNGEEGLKKAIRLIPDLILSDIMMPVMDGIQMLDKIKNDINTSHIPVVLLSARYSIESRIEGLRYGADCYITKPFHNEFLIASIDNLLRQRKKLFDSLVSKKPATELSPSPIVVTSGDETFLKEVIRVVEEKMTDPGFNMETIAESMNMSRSAFYKKFKSLTGLTTVEFVRDMRLQRSKQYFDAGSTNIAEVAYWSGFSNPKYFSTCFREKYQVSPSDYIKSKAGGSGQ